MPLLFTCDNRSCCCRRGAGTLQYIGNIVASGAFHHRFDGRNTPHLDNLRTCEVAQIPFRPTGLISIADEQTFVAFVAVLGAGALLLAGCGSDDKTDAAATTTTSAAATTTTKVLTKDEKFTAQLKIYGIFPTADQVPLLIPGAMGNCDTLVSMTVPDDQKFDKLADLAVSIAKMQGKTWLQEKPAAEAYIRASVEAYCPENMGLLPTS